MLLKSKNKVSSAHIHSTNLISTRLPGPPQLEKSGFGPIWVLRNDWCTVLHTKILTAPAHFRTKKSSLEAVTRGIDRHDVPKGQEYPQGHSRTGGGVGGVARAASARKIRILPYMIDLEP